MDAVTLALAKKYTDEKTSGGGSIPDATTNTKGIVKLNDTVTSNSKNEAATANAVKTAMDRANEAFQSGNDGKTLLETTLIAKKATVSKVGSIATFSELNEGILQLGEVSSLVSFYDRGLEQNALTGGWIPVVGDGSYGSGSQSKLSDHLYLSVSAGGSGRRYVTDKVVSLKNISKLYVDWECTAGNNHFAELEVTTAATKMGGTRLAAKSLYTTFTRKTDFIDVSALTGDYHIRAAIGTGQPGGTSILKVYRIWGDK